MKYFIPLFLGVSTLALACQRPPASTLAPKKASKAPAPTTPATDSDEGERQLPIYAGLGHSGVIHAVFPALDRPAAVTLDRRGELRFWPGLDGGHEPLPMPVGQVVTASLAATDTGYLAAAVDNSGATHLIDIQPTVNHAPGHAMSTGAVLGPDVDALDVAVLPDRQIAVVASDHSVRIYSHAGRLLSRLDRPSTRFVNLVRTGRQLVAVAMASTSELDSRRPYTSLVLHQLRVHSGGAVRARGQPMEIVVAGDRTTWPMRLAISPGGARALYLTRVGHNRPAVASRAFGDDSSTTEELNLGADWLEQTWHLGFVDERTGFLTAPYQDHSRIIRWAGPTDAATQLDIQPSSPTSHTLTGAPGFRSGMYLAGHYTSLLVRTFADDSTRYLGYRKFEPIVADVSQPDGDGRSWVAWGGESILVEPVPAPAGKTPTTGAVLDLSGAARQHGYEMFFVEGGPLLYADPSGSIQLIDWRTGALAGQKQLGDGIHGISFDRRASTLSVSNPRAQKSYLVASDGLRGISDAERVALETRGATPGFLSEVTGSDNSRQLTITSADGPGERRFPANSIQHHEQSPDGGRMLLLRNDSNVLIIERTSMAVSWQFDAGAPVKFVRWSADGARLVILTRAFGTVYDVAAQQRIRRRCAGLFTVTEFPHSNPLDGLPPKGLAAQCQ